MPGRLAGFLVAVATALVILGGSIVPFLTPAYIRVEQDRTGVEALTGWEPAVVEHVTSSIVHDLVLGGSFSAGDVQVLNDREQAHMRDVRGVFQGFFALVAVAVVVLAWTSRGAREPEARALVWRAVGSGARGLAVALVVAGAFALFAFDAAFEVFHRLFFSAGSYSFDPRTDRLVQLFPEQFWSETAIAVGAVAIVAAILTAWVAARRAATPGTAPALAATGLRT